METTNQFATGTQSPGIAMTAFCPGKNKAEELKKQQLIDLKNRVLKHIKSGKTAYISDMAEFFNVQPRFVAKAVDELVEEGLIKENMA